MKPNDLRPVPVLVLLPLLMLAGCSWLQPGPPPPPVVVSWPRVQPLPQAARQPPIPPFCQPTCSERLSSDFEIWRARLTNEAAPVGSAKPATTP